MGKAKIGLIGVAGLGKSGVAQKISRKTRLPLLLSKEITRPILSAHGYDYSRGTCIERFLSKKDIEFEIVNERVMRESLMKDGFVTDRTTLECFAYALLSVETYSDDEIKLLEGFCKDNMKSYTNLYYFQCKDGWFVDNGVRTVSAYFQWKIDMIIRGLLNDWKIDYSIVSPDNAADFISDSIQQ